MGYCQPFIFCRRTSVTVIRRTIKSVPAQKNTFIFSTYAHRSVGPSVGPSVTNSQFQISTLSVSVDLSWTLMERPWSIGCHTFSENMYVLCMVNLASQHRHLTPPPFKKAFDDTFICLQQISNSSFRFQDMAIRARISHFSQSQFRSNQNQDGWQMDHSPNLNP